MVVVGGYQLFQFATRNSERQQALELAKTGPLESARTAVLKCLEDDPDNPELLESLVDILIRSKATAAEIDPIAARWCLTRPDDATPYRVRLKTLLQLQDYSAAVPVAERLLELSPGEVPSRQDLCLALIALGRYDDARRECLILREASGRPELQRLLGQIELGRGDLPAAARALDDALAANPEDQTALLLRGTVHVRAGEYAQAVDRLRRVQTRDYTQRVARLNELGLALTRMNRMAEAGEVFDELTRYQDAIQLASEARIRPREIELSLKAAQALLRVKSPDEARELLEAAIRANGEDKSALILLAECHAGLGEAEKAHQARERAARLP